MRYRIKTEDEFIEEYGKDWKYEIDWCIHGRMDYLLGKEVDKNTEHQIDGWWIHEDMIIEITEKTMTEKIQMTEEQWRVVLINVFYCDEIEANKKLSALKNQGYVNKSELETLVEEVEEILTHNLTHNSEYLSKEKKEKTEKILKVIQALKKFHPEFSK